MDYNDPRLNAPLDAVFSSERYRETLAWLERCSFRRVLDAPLNGDFDRLLKALRTNLGAITSTRGVINGDTVHITLTEMRDYAVAAIAPDMTRETEEVVAATIVGSSSICKNFLDALEEARLDGRTMSSPTMANLVMLSQFVHIGVPTSPDYVRACFGLAADTVSGMMMLSAFASCGSSRQEATEFAVEFLEAAKAHDILPLDPAMMEDYVVYTNVSASDLALMIANGIAPDLAREIAIPSAS